MLPCGVVVAACVDAAKLVSVYRNRGRVIEPTVLGCEDGRSGMLGRIQQRSRGKVLYEVSAGRDEDDHGAKRDKQRKLIESNAVRLALCHQYLKPLPNETLGVMHVSDGNDLLICALSL